jgi:hypothetical protein
MPRPNDISRRDFLGGTLAFARVAALPQPPRRAAPQRAAAGTGSVIAYHDAPGAYHQDQLGVMRKQGYRLRSLSVYRDSQMRYAAVWVNASGPAWIPFHGLSAPQFQKLFDTWTAKGYRPTMIAATGGGAVGNQTSEASYAGVMEESNQATFARIGLDSAAFRQECAAAKDKQFVLRWAAVYGGRQREYAGIWESAPGVQWDFKISTVVDGNELGVPLVMPENPKLRLAFATRSAFAEYLSVYRSDNPPVQLERHGMTSAAYQTQYDTLTAQGYVPMCVQVGGDPRVGESPRFVALFGKRA